MKILERDNGQRYIRCMSNQRGRDVQVPGPLPFSFYFGSKFQEGDSESVHGIRVKLVPNPEKVIKSEFSVLELHGDMLHRPNPKAKIDSKTLGAAREFFKDNKVLFAAVWEQELDESDLKSYIEGRIPLKELVASLDMYEAHKGDLDKVASLEDLESVVREKSLFNMND